MHTQLFESVVTVYKRQERARRLKRILAWCGVVAAGALLMFCIGLYVMRNGIAPSLITVIVAGLLAWGIWGFVHLKTRD